MIFASVNYSKCWFAHLDLMGFSSLVENGDIDDVLDAYEEALESFMLKTRRHKNSNVSYTWFSDTFLIFSKGESIEEFTVVEQITRLFFQRLLYNKIPVRGAITFGDFYSQKTRNIFVGPALVDSYKYGEDQAWVGLILTPSAVTELERLSVLPAYRRYKPIPNGIMRTKDSRKIMAYDFEDGDLPSTASSLIDCLEDMQARAPSEVKHKYQLAIDFARHTTTPIEKELKITRIENCIIKFKCSQRWEHLAPTEDSNKRYCSQCEQSVYACRNDAQIAKHVRAGECVAIMDELDDVLFVGEVSAPYGK